MLDNTDEPNWVIYGLYLADNPLIRYVGYTTIGPSGRLKSHLKDSGRRNFPVYQWMAKHGKGKIRIRVLEVCPEEDYDYLDYCERYWIHSLKEFGSCLLNIEYGGRGGRRREFSDETRLKLAEASKKGWEKHPNRFKGIPKSDSWKASASKRVLGSKNPQFGSVWSIERRNAHSISIKAGIAHKNEHTPEFKVEGCTQCMKGKF